MDNVNFETPLAPLLEVEKLIKRYKVRRSLLRREQFTAVSGVSFQVKQGETLALVGESGCGKSSIGKCLLRLVDPDQGQIRFRGREIQQLSQAQFRPFRKHIQMVFQDPLSSFNPMIQIGGALTESLQLRDELSPADRKKEVIRLLETVELSADFATLYPRQMSGGQLQRVGIARALATHPELIFLDEPTSALDMSIRGQIVNLLLELQQERHLSYILVTHDLRLVREMADRVVVMYLGEVVETGTCDQIFHQPGHPYTKGLLSAARIGQTERRQRNRSFRLMGEILTVAPDYVGCKLSGRCPFAQDRCTQEPQHLQAILPGHQVRCWRALDIQSELVKEMKDDQILKRDFLK